MIIIKYLPNTITLVRIICSFLLFSLKPFSVSFFIVYTICGLSDVLDGYIARKLRYISEAGASLDSIADVIFIFSMMIIIVPIFKWSWWMLVWIGIIILMRLNSLLIGFIKYRALAFLHTYSNKMTGFLLFCFPFIHYIFELNVTVCILCGVATVSAIEEILINIISDELSRNIKSIVFVRREIPISRASNNK
ncbi:CDP-alcohol phosphatidyltransferase family protein [Clostridium butyricum]|uniref:CDP-alcohol phosphatidyltransferase family protein n=1 Tax=Clostridium butyricum TaxID=1492 RepID=UPI002103DE8E|nr:CDP-alcohol phosphatidyltransferase family protein [Clostridium butyricum]MCQ2017678.1 CDP-alcohol phosphatidyltransferase family protein [Clostridium butyricum]MCQ2021467.1 CDP-alcohol phosphatidyltransferase family protein [Clostridium butyricum]